jgi:hypothetical protein
MFWREGGDMATRHLIDRLSAHIDRIEIVLGARPAMAVIVQRFGETEDEATARHYAARPQDRDAELRVLVRRFTDVPLEPST